MSASEEEVALAARAVGGDADALEEVVRLVQDPVYRLAVRMAGRPADAEDATQEILIRVVTRLASWRAEASLVTWAYRIAVNYLLNLRRTPYERNEITFDALGESLASGLAEADYQGPDAELLATEVRLGCTQAMLQCLDRTERVAFVLGEVFALPSEQAGWILEVGAATYRKRLERARRRIRAFMSARCGLVDAGAPCRCSRRVGTALESGRVDRHRPVFAAHPAGRPAPPLDRPTSTEVGAGAGQMRRLHEVAVVLRSHPDYTAPRSRSQAVLSLIRSGRFPILSEDGGVAPVLSSAVRPTVRRPPRPGPRHR